MVNAVMTLMSDCVRNDTYIVDQPDVAEKAAAISRTRLPVIVERLEGVAIDKGDIIDRPEAGIQAAPLGGSTHGARRLRRIAARAVSQRPRQVPSACVRSSGCR